MAYPQHTIVQRAKPVPVHVPARFLGRLAMYCGALLVGLALLIVSSPWAHAVRPITITMIQNLDFGNVGSSLTSGTVVIDPVTGTKTVTGGAMDLGGVHTTAIFSITGEKNIIFTITLPSQITMTAPGGGTAVVDAFTSSPSGFGIFNQQGQATVIVGARLNTSGVMVEGPYTVPFSITVAY